MTNKPEKVKTLYSDIFDSDIFCFKHKTTFPFEMTFKKYFKIIQKAQIEKHTLFQTNQDTSLPQVILFCSSFCEFLFKYSSSESKLLLDFSIAVSKSGNLSSCTAVILDPI